MISDKVYGYYKKKIESGEFAPGYVLPSISEDAETFGCSKEPVIRARRDLEADGLITTRNRQRPVVADRTDDSSRLTPFQQKAHEKLAELRKRVDSIHEKARQHAEALMHECESCLRKVSPRETFHCEECGRQICAGCGVAVYPYGDYGDNSGYVCLPCHLGKALGEEDEG